MGWNFTAQRAALLTGCVLCLVLGGPLGCGDNHELTKQELIALLGSYSHTDTSRQTNDVFLGFALPTSRQAGSNALDFVYSPPGSASFSGQVTFQNSTADNTGTVQISGPNTPVGVLADGATLTIQTTLSANGNQLTTVLTNAQSQAQTENWQRVVEP